jgi:hypothetical protein
MTIDKAQAWWDKTKADLRLRRGESGRKLLDLAGEVGYSPYRLRRALERITPVLQRWVTEDQAPAWAERLHRQCKQFLSVVECVPPMGDEMGV